MAEIFERFSKQRRSPLLRILLNPTTIKIPLWDPDAFLTRTLPFVRPVLGWLGGLIWLGVVGLAVIFAAPHWAELTDNVTDRIFSAQNLLLLSLIYPVVKIIHEFGHAYAAKFLGAEVRQMGVMFILFMPMAYVDVSGTASLRSKYQRAMVAAAGIIVELLIAALALHLWLILEPGLIRALAFNAVVVAGVSTVVFNGNPLMRYDGYHILSDLIEIPNLGVRANRYCGYLVDKRLFGASGSEFSGLMRGEAPWLVVYAPAAFVYRVVVQIGIAFYLANAAFFVGVLLALWSVTATIVLPIVRGLRHVCYNPGLQKTRQRAVAITFGGALAALLIVSLVPMPLHTTTEGVVWLPNRAILRTASDGFAKELLIAPGRRVRPGDAILASEDPEEEAQLPILRARVTELHDRFAAAEFRDLSAAAIARFELAAARADLDRSRQKVRGLTLRSEADGTLAIPKVEDLPGRFFSQGAVIGYVIPDTGNIVRATVAQDDIDLVRRRLRGIEVKFVDRVASTYQATVLREVPSASRDLPDKALGAEGGGQTVVDPRDQRGQRTLARFFQFDLAVAGDLPPEAFGSRVYVRFEHEWEPLAVQAIRRLKQVLLARLQF